MDERHFSGLGEIEMAYMDVKEKLGEYEGFASDLTEKYQSRIMRLLNDSETPMYLREHYAESSNYYTNSTLEGMVDTLNWLSYTDKDKMTHLDEELNSYFTVCEI